MIDPMRWTVGRRPLGIWIALYSMLWCILVGGGGQLLSFVNWDWAVRLGLQEHDLNDPGLTDRLLAHVEWGTSAGDTLLVLPLFLLGVVGVMLRRRWGMIAALMAAISWVYMFVVYVMQRHALVRAGLVQWESYSGVITAFALLALLPCLLIIWGLAANAGRFAVPRPHSHMLRRREDGLEPFLVADFLICACQVLRTIPLVWIGRRSTWNVSREEVDCRLAGDGCIRSGTAVNRAITVRQPPARVWPWIAQFGRGAAYYSWDFIDNPGHRHPDYLIDAPEPAIGDWCEALGEIRHLEAGRELVWYDEPDFFGIRTPLAIDFRLNPVGDGATRVHFRMTFDLPRTIRGRIALRVGMLMDHVMSTEMLRRLQALVETYDERLRNGETNRHLAPHQKTAWRPAAAAAGGPPAPAGGASGATQGRPQT